MNNFFTLMKAYMKMFFFLWSCVVSLESQAQPLKNNCSDCNERCLCIQAIGGAFNSDERHLLAETWDDYEGIDLEEHFPAKGIKHIESVKFDALGCVYPSFVNGKVWKELFLRDNLHYTDLQRRSFFNLLREYPTSTRSLAPQYTKLFDELRQYTDGDIEKADFFDFRKKWNDFFLRSEVDRLNDKIKSNDLTHCIFFISGYNVPYSLTHLQGNAFFTDLVDSLPSNVNPDKVLFVRVFWPSNDAKRKTFGPETCNMTNIKNLKVGRLYSFIANRGYLAGLALRTLFNALEPNTKINVASHSFGACISASIVLSPVTKMTRQNSPFNARLIAEFKNTPIPQRPITFFLSAPGIPGKSTFAALNKDSNNLHVFYICHNRKDEILRKKDAKVILPIIMNATSLGCNWMNEVKRTRKMASKRQLVQNFVFSRTSYMKNHDIFCYRLQEGFKTHFSSYIKAGFL